MMIELPENLGAALKAEANAHGVSADGYARELLKRDLAPSLDAQSSSVPFKTGRGMFAKYGQAPSADEIDANRAGSKVTLFTRNAHVLESIRSKRSNDAYLPGVFIDPHITVTDNLTQICASDILLLAIPSQRRPGRHARDT